MQERKRKSMQDPHGTDEKQNETSKRSRLDDKNHDHNSQSQYKCDVCDQSLDLIQCGNCSRSYHIKCIVVTEIPKGDWLCHYCHENTLEYKCMKCPITYKTEIDLSNHTQYHQSKNSFQIKTNEFNCKMEPKSPHYSQKSFMGLYKKCICGEFCQPKATICRNCRYTFDGSSRKEGEYESDDSITERISCEGCKTEFNSRKECREHQSLCQTKYCDRCNVDFSNRTEFKFHLSTHLQSALSCDKCPMKF